LIFHNFLSYTISVNPNGNILPFLETEKNKKPACPEASGQAGCLMFDDTLFYGNDAAEKPLKASISSNSATTSSCVQGVPAPSSPLMALVGAPHRVADAFAVPEKS
jgi:hypothetical protein